MSESKHTPGPWFKQKNSCGEIGRPAFPGGWTSADISDEGGKLIAITYGDFETCKANAALITAAPDMLEALELLIAEIKKIPCTCKKEYKERGLTDHACPRCDCGPNAQSFENARAAIAKAKGE